MRNNIFYESSTVGLYLRGWTKAGREGVILENNCWYQEAGPLVLIEDTEYTMAQFEEYRTATDNDINSIIANPMFRDIASLDLHLAENSPCIGAGKETDVKSDCDGAPRDGRMDIGAFAAPYEK